MGDLALREELRQHPVVSGKMLPESGEGEAGGGAPRRRVAHGAVSARRGGGQRKEAAPADMGMQCKGLMGAEQFPGSDSPARSSPCPESVLLH